MLYGCFDVIGGGVNKTSIDHQRTSGVHERESSEKENEMW